MALGLRSARPKLPAEHLFTSDARAALALLIAEREARQEKKATEARALAAADARLAELREAVEAAAAAVDAARDMAAAALTAGAPVPPSGLREAREALVDARDAFAVMQEVKAQLLASQIEPHGQGYSPEFAEARDLARIPEAAARVIREHPICDTILPDLLAAETAYLRHAATLRWLVQCGAMQLAGAHDLSDAHSRTESAMRWAFADEEIRPAFGETIPCRDGGRARIYAETRMRVMNQPLQAAMVALQRDANAPLPEIS